MGEGRALSYTLISLLALIIVNFVVVGIGATMVITHTVDTLTLSLLIFASLVDIGIIGCCIHYGMMAYREGC